MYKSTEDLLSIECRQKNRFSSMEFILKIHFDAHGYT